MYEYIIVNVDTRIYNLFFKMLFLYYVPNNQARVKSPTLPIVCGLWESHQFDGNVGRLEVVTDRYAKSTTVLSKCLQKTPPL